MKKCLLLGLVIMLAVSVVGIVGCGGKPGLSGTYIHEDDSESYLELKADGTFYLYYDFGLDFGVRTGFRGGMSGTYKIEGDTIILSSQLGSAKLWISGNVLLNEQDKRWVKEGKSSKEEPLALSEPTTPVATIQKARTDDIEWLAAVIASEAGSVWDIDHWVGCTDEERAAVGWTVLNRLSSGSFGKTVKEVVTAPGQYATNQQPTSKIRGLAKELLEGQILDNTGGATHFFSPTSMPKEGESTAGFDVGDGLHEVKGIVGKVYFPSWTRTYAWVGDLSNVRRAYFVFYRFGDAATRTAMGPSNVIRAFYEAFSKERYSEVVSYYGPKLQTEVLATREGYKKMYPEKSNADIWISAITNTVGEAFYLEPKGDGWITLLDMERIEITNEKISEDGNTAVVEFTVYCKYGVEYSEPRGLNKTGDVWQIGE